MLGYLFFSIASVSKLPYSGLLFVHILLLQNQLRGRAALFATIRGTLADSNRDRCRQKPGIRLAGFFTSDTPLLIAIEFLESLLSVHRPGIRAVK